MIARGHMALHLPGYYARNIAANSFLRSGARPVRSGMRNGMRNGATPNDIYQARRRQIKTN